MQFSQLLPLRVALFLFSRNRCSVLNKIKMLLMRYATSCSLGSRSFEGYGGIVKFTRIFWWSDCTSHFCTLQQEIGAGHIIL